MIRTKSKLDILGIVMGHKLKLSTKSTDYLEFISNKLDLKKFIICRMALSKAIAGDFKSEEYGASDSNGTEFNKSTLLGKHEYLYRALITQEEGRLISEEEFFPELTKKYIEFGLYSMHAEYGVINSPTEFLKRYIEV